jgi:hypothetical protein
MNSARTYKTSLFTGRNYTLRIAAKILELPFHSGGRFGQKMRITGTGFSQ